MDFSGILWRVPQVSEKTGSEKDLPFSGSFGGRISLWCGFGVSAFSPCTGACRCCRTVVYLSVEVERVQRHGLSLDPHCAYCRSAHRARGRPVGRNGSENVGGDKNGMYWRKSRVLGLGYLTTRTGPERHEISEAPIWRGINQLFTSILVSLCRNLRLLTWRRLRRILAFFEPESAWAESPYNKTKFPNLRLLGGGF